MLAYVNADIIVLPDFLASAKEVHQMKHQFLLVGQRWDLDIRDEIDFSSDWEEKTRNLIQEKESGCTHLREVIILFSQGIASPISRILPLDVLDGIIG